MNALAARGPRRRLASMGSAIDLAVAIAAAAIGAIAVWVPARARLRRAHAAMAAAEQASESYERRALEENETRGVILASMEEGVLLTDPSDRVTFANEAYERHLGTKPRSVREIRPMEIRRAVYRSGFTGATVSVEVETGAPARWLEATAQAIGDHGGVLLIVRDVTEARRLDAVRRDFVANASHELKTPIASILATAETLRTGAIEETEAAYRFTSQLERDAVRLNRLVSDLLDLSRLEGGSDRSEQVHLDAVVQDEIDRLSTSAEEAGLSLHVHIEGVAPITGSERDLALLARNLIENAIRYTDPGGSVTIEVGAESAASILRVSDTGTGISQRDVGRIFERFYRVDQARSRETGGTGLGLALVRHVCENHGGEVRVDSELGQGATFEVRLPTTEPDTSP
jgi:signal transduction histidine kinase